MTHTHTKAVRVVLAFLLFGLIVAAAVAPTLTFKFSPVTLPGAPATWLYGVNNSGVMVGQYFDAQHVGHGFSLDQQGNLTTIDPPQSIETVCNGINSTGAIVGTYWMPSDNVGYGFLYENGKFTQIGPVAHSSASGINDMGEIVGTYVTKYPLTAAFLWNGQQYTQLSVPGAQTTEGVSINNQGAIALIGTYLTPPTRSYLYHQGKYTEIKVPGATQTYVYGINNFGDLIMTYDVRYGQGGIHGALRHKMAFYKFDFTPNYTFAYGLNDYHLIVGDSFTSTAFKATF
jgi:hypothetical protein